MEKRPRSIQYDMYFLNMLLVNSVNQVSCIIHTFMGSTEGLDSPRCGVGHRDTSDMKTKAQDGVVYMKRQEPVNKATQNLY